MSVASNPNDFTDNFGHDTHGTELHRAAKSDQVKAAEACFAGDVDDEAQELLRMTPQRLVVACHSRAETFSADKIVSPLPQS